MLSSIVVRTRNSALFISKRLVAGVQAKVHCQMGKVYLRKAEDSEKLDINFRYVNAGLNIDRVFNFSRSLAELVDITVSRIQSNLVKEIEKQQKRIKRKKELLLDVSERTEPCIATPYEVYFWHDNPDSRLSDITITQLINDCEGLHLRLINDNYDVVLDEPWIKGLELPKCILANFMVYPYKIEMQFADLHHSRATWHRTKMPHSCNMKDAVWEYCSSELVYTPKDCDIGYYLKIVLTPCNEHQIGPPYERISNKAVQPGLICPFESRHKFTSKRLEDIESFRVVSYNILAEMYATTETAATELFPYCSKDIIDMNYRRPLIMKEVIGYNADILCFQEVDARIFNRHLKPLLALPKFGSFDGHFAEKGESQEGSATFFNTERFECLENFKWQLGEHLSTLPVLAPIWNKIALQEALVKRVTKVPTTLQITVLKCKVSDRYVIVANTHLFFHPDSDHIRLLQAGLSCLLIQKTYNDMLEKWKIADERKLAVLFCGDFNSTPEFGVYKLMTEGYIDEQCADWKSKEDEAICDIRLKNPYKMGSACGTPPYTNYTPLFAGCLDYIFFQLDRLEIKQSVPLPSDEEVKADTAIPSKVFPSDHIALVADLKFKHSN